MRLFELLCGSIFNRRLRSTVPNAFCCYLVYCYVRYVSLIFFLNTRYVRPLLIRTYVYYFERAILSKRVFILQTRGVVYHTTSTVFGYTRSCAESYVVQSISTLTAIRVHAVPWPLTL